MFDSKIIDVFKRAFHEGKPVLRGFAGAFLDFIYPPNCQACQLRLEQHDFLCGNCRVELLLKMNPVAQSRQSDFPNLQKPLQLKQVCTLWHFGSIIEQLIHRVKYQGETGLGQWLGSQVDKNHPFFQQFETMPLVIPVPLHGLRKRERGYNQSEFIARGAAKAVGAPIDRRCLKRCRSTRTQTQLTARERQHNVEGAFRVAKPERIRNRTVLLVDDVITTGATVNQCAEVLLKAGSGAVYALALARPVEWSGIG